MTKPSPNRDDPEDAVAYLIDEQFVDMRSRSTNRVMLAMWVVAQIWLWCWYFSPSLKDEQLISILVADIGCTLCLWFAMRVGTSWAKRTCVLLTDTRLIVNRCGGSSVKVLELSKENPVVIRKGVSGKNWELSSRGSASKSLKLSCGAFSGLAQWAMAVGEGKLRVESTDE